MDINVDINGMPEGLCGCARLSFDEIQTLKFKELLEIFFEDSRQQDDSRIKKLFESGNISSRQLTEMADRPRCIFSGLSEIVYGDMAVLLSEKIVGKCPFLFISF